MTYDISPELRARDRKISNLRIVAGGVGAIAGNVVRNSPLPDWLRIPAEFVLLTACLQSVEPIGKRFDKVYPYDNISKNCEVPCVDPRGTDQG